MKKLILLAICLLLFSCTKESNGITINIPGILIFGLVVVLYWIRYSIVSRSMGMEAIPLVLFGIILTFVYVYYAIWWLYSHWSSIGVNIPFHIHIT